MKRMTAIATALFMPLALSAETDPDTRAIVERFVQCFEGKLTGKPDAERLACYDAMSTDLVEMIASGAPLESETCQITGFSIANSSSDMRVMAGESSCRDGRFSYRLTRDGQFLTAGSAFVRGFVFEDVVTFSGDTEGVQMSFTFQ